MKRAIGLWTKRIFIGLITLVAIALLVLALFIVAEKQWMAQFNRTHERPLQVDYNQPLLADTHRLLSKLQPTSRANSLQFVVMPSFGQRWFAVSLAEVGGKGVGEAIVETRDPEHLERRTFILPKAELHRFLERWDALTDGYAGEGRGLTDGNALAFERQRGDRITSGIGNSPCHYDVLGDWAARRLSQFAPQLRDLRQVDLDKLLKSDFCNRSILSW